MAVTRHPASGKRADAAVDGGEEDKRERGGGGGLGEMAERSRQFLLIGAGVVLGSISTVALLKLYSRCCTPSPPISLPSLPGLRYGQASLAGGP